MQDFIPYYFITGLCMLFSVFFSGIETAIISARRLTIETLNNKGNKGAHRGIYILDHVEEAIGMVLIGNNIVNISASAFITYILTKGYMLNDTGIIIATVIETIVLLLFCEIVPKIISKSNSESFLIFFSFPIILLMRVLKPLVIVSLSFTEFIKKRFDMDSKKTGLLNSREDIATYFSIGHKEGIIDLDNKFYVSEILSFRETQVYEVMIPFQDAVVIEIESPIRELVSLVEKTKFSRIPVYRDIKENVCGYVYYRDIFKGNVKTVSEILHKPVFIPETKNIFELYIDMTRRRIPMVFAVNEYGDTSGFLTVEDIAEEIVGDIDTADHSVEDSIIKINDRKYSLSGRLDIDYFIRYFNIDIRKKHFETLAGFLISLNGDIPSKGDHIRYEDCEFIIDEISQRRIEKVQLILPRGKKK